MRAGEFINDVISLERVIVTGRVVSENKAGRLKILIVYPEFHFVFGVGWVYSAADYLPQDSFICKKEVFMKDLYWRTIVERFSVGAVSHCKYLSILR